VRPLDKGQFKELAKAAETAFARTLRCRSLLVRRPKPPPGFVERNDRATAFRTLPGLGSCPGSSRGSNGCFDGNFGGGNTPILYVDGHETHRRNLLAPTSKIICFEEYQQRKRGLTRGQRLARFVDSTTNPDGCHEFHGSVMPANGYGQIADISPRTGNASNEKVVSAAQRLTKQISSTSC
jgi:hypothetical protein